jgi:ribulose-bisphosphate carboxylase large chain
VVAGNLKKVRLQDVIFPQSIIRAHKGPRFGIEDARKILGVYDRPLVCTIVKPRMGLVKDDEALTDQGFCPLILRLEAVMSALGRVEKETGKKAFYAVSVTAGADRILERAEEAVDHGANMVMIDVLPAGFSSLEPLSQNLNVPIHVHRTLQGASARDKSHGISMLVIAKLVRMVGGTNLHTGSCMGKMSLEREENDLCRDALREEWVAIRGSSPWPRAGSIQQRSTGTWMAMA